MRESTLTFGVNTPLGGELKAGVIHTSCHANSVSDIVVLFDNITGRCNRYRQLFLLIF